ncbi:B3 domain-containing transcription repressor VAL1-like [Pyrus ussuriensis x Pyrus communis]|uniref:B3 domain-containing transcription repressor VAL1-like n=1 Tax=Pyrus ussuriensis x Pyrus communis TaxID=2448454 RepID=A0A5N5G098_9ROSA|nr:B3 domain-containing transcription repressor VAL1-like [Pyrus ussuriensis x Pyrus communis]
MESKICMNPSCRMANTHEWKKGWPLRTGGFAHLCYKCGVEYENSVYCNTFHSGETGWRDCNLCHKPLHCGCIVSETLYECLDFGGIGCIGCASQPRMIQDGDVLNGFGGLKISDSGDQQSTVPQNGALSDTANEGKLLQLCQVMEANESNLSSQSQRGEINVSPVQTKREEVTYPRGEVGPGFSSISRPSFGSLTFAKPDNGRIMIEVKDMNKPSSDPSLSMTLGGPSATPNFAQPFTGGILERRDQIKTSSSFQQGQKIQPIFPRPLRPPPPVHHVRVARPPAEGRGKSQLLPRYWPRITDQELQKLAGDLNSTIVPLFEKVLSASDAGRIGRLVLPKACAEAYFPPISQSEGLPIRIQDVKGNEWTFQFRFWPNNNSRMYVLEGVTPCIQSMQLQAGDTVTFSRIDPGGRLVIGFRKASRCLDVQESQTSFLPNGTPGETSCPSVVENLVTGSGHSSIYQTSTGSKDPYLNALSGHLHLADGDTSLHDNENHSHFTSEDLQQKPVSNSDKKRARNIGPKSKRLLLHSEDVLELRLTWEEAQDLLRPPPSVKPSIVTIEDHEFEEYDEPPVFGKRSLFIAESERQEQWAQCDDCSKWRRLPVDVLLPPKWTCSENSWDINRCSCSAPEEVSQKELNNLLRPSKDLKKRRIVVNHNEAQEHEPSGLDALASASAAILGDSVDYADEQSVGATTRHPRHRPGCTCIVCIQPPSGKGKHKPTCTCNVCMTVKRRFKTLMMNKRKRKSEREMENAHRDNNDHKDESEMNGTSTEIELHMNHLSENGSSCEKRIQADVAESSCAGQIDLNCEPKHNYVQVSGLNLLRLADAVAQQPVKNSTKESGLTNRMCKPQAGLGSSLRTQDTAETDKLLCNEGSLSSVAAVWDLEGRGDGD